MAIQMKGENEMTEANAITIYSQFDQMQRAALALHKSGYFTDAKSEAQAVVKVMAGAELGLPPFASMAGINIIHGKPALGANVIATLVKNDPRYNYNPKVHDNEQCVIEWYENGNKTGESSFTMADAKIAGLTGKDGWKKFPSDMLFARAITRGSRRFAPGIFGGSPIYTPEELGAEVDADGDVIEAPIVEVTTTEPENQSKPEPTPEPTNGTGEIYAAVVEADLSENEHAAMNALGKCKTGWQTTEKALAWMKVYRAWRDMGKESDEAAENANENVPF
jgi:hypothetical protein